MKLTTLIYVLSAIVVAVLLFSLTKQYLKTPGTKSTKTKAFHYTTVELDLMDKDTVQVHFKTVTGKFELDSLHHVVEMDSVAKLAAGVLSFKILSDSIFRVADVD